jgi:putative DNA primase/helicase
LLHYIINKHAARFKKYDGRKKEEVLIPPPDKLLEMILNHGHGPFPRVVGVVNAPTMRPDGTILTSSGYDPATALWYEPDSI